MGKRSAVQCIVGLLAVVVLAACEVPCPDPEHYLPDALPGSLSVEATVECRFKDAHSGHGAEGVETELDVYLPDPEQHTGPRPVIVYFHGGGWLAGDKADIDFSGYKGGTHVDRGGGAILAQQALGWVVVSAEYRFSQFAPFPAQAVDAKAAVNCARGLTDQVDVEIDQERVAVAGSSAGGHLAMLVGLTPGKWEPTAPAGGDGLDGSASSTEVFAVVNLDGPNDLSGMPVSEPGYDGTTNPSDYLPQLICGESWVDEGNGNKRVMCFEGEDWQDDWDNAVQAASPLTYASLGDHPNLPRIYLACGDTDPIWLGPLFVECADHRAMYNELRDAYGEPEKNRVFIDDTFDNLDNPERPGTTGGHHFSIDTHLNFAALTTVLNG